MKAIMVIIDGLADEKIKELGDQTTFDSAVHPHLDQLTAAGFRIDLNPCPEGYIPESMPCILNLLGVGTEFFPQSRASLELLSHGYTLNSDEVVLRCNLAGIDQNQQLCSFNGGSLTPSEMVMASALAVELHPAIKFIHLSGYRNLLIVKKDVLKKSDCRTYPPHEFLGVKTEELLAELCSSSEILKEFVTSSVKILQRFETKKIKYIFYPWGISEKSSLPSFVNLYQHQAAAVCGAEIAKGIALDLGMYVPSLKEFTADVDTDLTLKASTACSLLADYDFVLVHINGTDEASHRCDYWEKIRFIERIDQEFFSYLLGNLDRETRILVCADHGTSPVTGKHRSLDVPFIIKNGGSPQGYTNPSKVLQSFLSDY